MISSSHHCSALRRSRSYAMQDTISVFICRSSIGREVESACVTYRVCDILGGHLQGRLFFLCGFSSCDGSKAPLPPTRMCPQLDRLWEMKSLCLVLIVTAAALTPALSKKAGSQPFSGRWDLTVTTPKDTYPSWMEFTET